MTFCLWKVLSVGVVPPRRSKSAGCNSPKHLPRSAWLSPAARTQASVQNVQRVKTCWNMLKPAENGWKSKSSTGNSEIPWKFWHLRPTVQHLSDSEDDAPRPAGNQEPWVRLRLRIKAVCGSWRVKETLQRKCHLQTLGSLGPSFTMLDRRINHHQPHLKKN